MKKKTEARLWISHGISAVSLLTLMTLAVGCSDTRPKKSAAKGGSEESASTESADAVVAAGQAQNNSKTSAVVSEFANLRGCMDEMKSASAIELNKNGRLLDNKKHIYSIDVKKVGGKDVLGIYQFGEKSASFHELKGEDFKKDKDHHRCLKVAIAADPAPAAESKSEEGKKPKEAPKGDDGKPQHVAINPVTAPAQVDFMILSWTDSVEAGKETYKWIVSSEKPKDEDCKSIEEMNFSVDSNPEYYGILSGALSNSLSGALSLKAGDIEKEKSEKISKEFQALVKSGLSGCSKSSNADLVKNTKALLEKLAKDFPEKKEEPKKEALIAATPAAPPKK